MELRGLLFKITDFFWLHGLEMGNLWTTGFLSLIFVFDTLRTKIHVDFKSLDHQDFFGLKIDWISKQNSIIRI